MKENKGTMESVTLCRVPDSERKNWWTVALIQAGIMISIPCIMVGSTLASGMGLGDATIAIVVGYAMAVFFMTLIGMQSSDLGRPMCVVASSAFGKTGVRIFMMTLFSAALICWFGYQTVVCGEAFSNLLKEFFGINFSVTASIILWGVIMLVTAVWGINALGWLNNIAIPALVIVIGIAAVIAMAFGGQSCGMVVTGDITRFQKSRKDTVLATVLGVFPVSIIMIILGYVLSVMTGDADISNILCILGLPLLGMLVLIAATWTTNTTNSYSAGIDMVMLFNTKESSRVLMTIIAGILGTVLALTGIMYYFGTFLTLCGYAFGPVAGVMVADYWIIRKGNPEKWFYKDGFDWVGIISWAAGVIFTFIFGNDYAVFIGIVLSFVLYLILRKIIQEKQNIVDEVGMK